MDFKEEKCKADEKAGFISDNNNPRPDEKVIPKRATWASKFEFVLMIIGYSVGLGNLWRFPYLCYKNGGGAFLVPYLIVTVFCAFPVVVLEMAIGQYVGAGVLTFWDICPLFKGIGISHFMINATVPIYYMIIISYTLHYMFASCSSQLPWESCDNEWNTQQCSNGSNINNISDYGNITTWMNKTSIALNISGDADRVSPAEEYLNYRVLSRSGSIEEIGSIQWELALCVLLAWLIISFITIKGITSSGKVAYFTATVPYLMLTILLVQGCMQEGAVDGIYYFLMPQWEKLKDTSIWYSAAMQVFYSVGQGNGMFITMASYNKFNNNIIRDASIMMSVNMLTSLFAGSVVFTFLGGLAHRLQMPVGEVAESGPSLVFVAYPTAVSTLPIPQLWSVCFFFMAAIMGMSSVVAHFETVASAIIDLFPRLRSTKNRVLVGFLLAVLFFLCGLIFVTEGGTYVFTLLDWYIYTFAIMTMTIAEYAAFCWCFGFDNLSTALYEMLGKRPNWFFKVSWRVISPILLLLIFVMTIVTWKSPTLGSYVFPFYANVIGWCLTMFYILPLPAMIVWTLVNAQGKTFKQKWTSVTSPTDSLVKQIAQRKRCTMEKELLHLSS